jgi:mannose-6-phosphate isomerase
MSAETLYPLRFEPIFQYRLWGGRGLEAWMNTPLPGDGPIGEAWVLSDRGDHPSLVAEGPLKGRSIVDLMASAKTDILGPGSEQIPRFPLLLKFLDVRKMLSVQVHPQDDRSDLIPPGESGKTEAWVVLQASPEGRIFAGLNPGVEQEALKGVSLKTADAVLASFKPEIGQGVLIEAGTVHALGDGVMVFEVQENSDVTFRLFDWEHVDPKTGAPRPLQVEAGLACADFHRGPVHPVDPALEAAEPAERERLFDDPHFRLWRIRSQDPFEVGTVGAPRVLVCIEGSGTLDHQGHAFDLTRGGVMLLPAVVGVCRFTPRGPCTLLEIATPEIQ